MERKIDNTEIVEIKKEKKSVGKKIFIAIVVLFLTIIIGAVGAVFIYLNSLGINFFDRNQTEDTSDNTNDSVLYEDIKDEEEKEEYFKLMTAIRDDSDMSTRLRSWYTNGGDHMSSQHVLNILIIGMDASGTPMNGNTDVMMLASVDKKKGRISLCSFLRDSYTYYETSPGNGHYSKLNAAYPNGGADCLVSAIENNYKIKIDYFVAVDFDAFIKVIDAIGGINMDVTDDEARAIEAYANISGVPRGGNVHLNGEQALLFARMRKIYATGDVHRTENQRKVINAVIKKSRTLGLSDINKVVQTLAQYVYTDCPMTKIVSLGTNAILGKWYNFQVYSMVAPPESAREPYSGSTWMWLVDYPYSAQYVQKQLYGETNIAIQ